MECGFCPLLPSIKSTLKNYLLKTCIHTVRKNVKNYQPILNLQRIRSEPVYNKWLIRLQKKTESSFLQDSHRDKRLMFFLWELTHSVLLSLLNNHPLSDTLGRHYLPSCIRWSVLLQQQVGDLDLPILCRYMQRSEALLVRHTTTKKKTIVNKI